MAVYYLRADNGAIKIGYSKTPKNRFVELNTASPLNLEIVAYEAGGMDVERKRHQQYRAQGIRGEWFRPCPQLDRHITKLNPDYVPMPYIDRGEHERISKKLDNLSLWFSVNRDNPPKIAYVVTIVCLVIGGAVSLLAEYGIDSGVALTTDQSYLVAFIASPIFIFVITGYILVKVWQLKYFWRKVRSARK